jgi:hypothetical protein
MEHAIQAQSVHQKVEPTLDLVLPGLECAAFLPCLAVECHQKT